MSPRRSQTDEPRPDDVEQASETQEEATAAPAQEEDVAPLVEGAPVSAAARHNVRYAGS